MIKARDLIIGCYYYGTDGTANILEEADLPSALKARRQIDPIPLDEEWLQRFGINTPTNDYPYHFTTYGIDYFYANGKLKAFTLGVCWASFPCDFVHQLQNLYYALTGEELKILNR